MPNSNGRPQPAVVDTPQTPTAAAKILTEMIERYGIRLPILTDQSGTVVDGKKRKPITDSLGIACPTLVQEFASEEERDQVAAAFNLARYLDPMPKRELIRAFLLLRPTLNNKELADAIGVSQNTVADERKELEATFQIEKSETFLGRDGKHRPAHYRPRKQVIANTQKELIRAQSVIAGLPDSCDGRIVDVTTASRRARKNVKRQKFAGEVILPTPDQDIRLYHCRFQDIEKKAGFEPNSIDAYITDIPYGEAFLPQLEELAQIAAKTLKQGGLFVTHYGHAFLDRAMPILSQHLTYVWAMATLLTNPNIFRAIPTVSKWKPILIYCKGPWKPRGVFPDILHDDHNEKEYHPWQQPLTEVESLLRYFSKPGDLVLDPCAGSFTTALACRNLGRRFIGCDIDEQCVIAGQQRLAATPVAPTLTEFHVTLADRSSVVAAASPREAAVVMAENYRLDPWGPLRPITHVSESGDWEDGRCFATESLFETPSQCSD